MAGSVYTFVGNSDSSRRIDIIETSQGNVSKGQSGLFLSGEVQAARSVGCVMQAGPAASPASLLTALSVAGTGTGSLNGTYRWAVTFVTAAGETTLGPEITATLASKNAAITNIPTAPPLAGVTARKIYRTAVGGASGTEKLVATINDDTTTTFTDTVADGSLGAAAPTNDSSAVIGGLIIPSGTVPVDIPAWQPNFFYPATFVAQVSGVLYARNADGFSLATWGADQVNWTAIAGGSGGASLDLIDNPSALGTASPGSGPLASPATHVHPMPRLDQVLAPTADVSMASHKLVGLAPGVAPTDGATVSQLSSGGGNVTATNSAANGYTLIASGGVSAFPTATVIDNGQRTAPENPLSNSGVWGPISAISANQLELLTAGHITSSVAGIGASVYSGFSAADVDAFAPISSFSSVFSFWTRIISGAGYRFKFGFSDSTHLFSQLYNPAGTAVGGATTFVFNPNDAVGVRSLGTTHTFYKASLSATLSAGLSTSSPITSIPASVTTNIAAGTVITVLASTGQYQQFTVAAPGATSGGTSIPVNSQTPSFAFPSGSSVYGNWITIASQTDSSTTASGQVAVSASTQTDVFSQIAIGAVTSSLVVSWQAPPWVTQIVAGTGVTISPTGGTGVVTINSTGGGSGGLNVPYGGAGLDAASLVYLSELPLIAQTKGILSARLESTGPLGVGGIVQSAPYDTQNPLTVGATGTARVTASIKPNVPATLTGLSSPTGLDGSWTVEHVVNTVTSLTGNQVAAIPSWTPEQRYFQVIETNTSGVAQTTNSFIVTYDLLET